MKTSLWVALILLAVVIAGGIAASESTKKLSERYLSAAEELQILTEDGQWQRAEETAQVYEKDWEKTASWLQTLLDHEDIDDVTMALRHIRAGIRAQEKAMCFEACAELKEHAQHLHHKDALTLANIL